jgi:hypothetical protein
MIDINNPKCMFTDCLTHPAYNYEGIKKGIYCNLHKKDGMINVVSPTCKTPNCTTQAHYYNGYCLRCHVHLFPDEPNSRNYKTKERAVVEYVLNKFPKEKYTWIEDKQIQDGCSKKRPDLLLDLGYQVIIIEVDENQHETYDCSCENKRLMLLSQDVGHRPIVFIRFNPDDYNMNNKKITSCWKIDGRGMCAIKKTKQQEWEERLEILSEQIKYWIEPYNKSEKTIQLVHLFYDTNFNKSDNVSEEQIPRGGAGY